MSKALKEAARFDLIVNNVAQPQTPPKVDGVEVQIIEEHRLQDLLAKLRDRPIYPKVIISLFTGLRRGELLALRWRHIDLDHKIFMVREALEETKGHGIRFKAPKSKAGKRDISLPDIVVESLREYRREQLELRLRLGLGKLSDDDLLFSTPEGEPLSPRIFSVDWGRVPQPAAYARQSAYRLWRGSGDDLQTPWTRQAERPMPTYSAVTTARRPRPSTRR